MNYKEIAQIAYDTSLNIHVFESISPKEKEIIDGFPDLFREHCHYYNGNHIRNIFRDVLQECSPVSVRESGGVYFVPETYRDTVEQLEHFAETLKPFTISEWQTKLYFVPVQDGDREQEMVKDSLDRNVAEETQKLLDELSSAEELSARGIKTLVGRIKKLQGVVQDYEKGLGMVAQAKEDLESASKKALRLLMSVED